MMRGGWPATVRAGALTAILAVLLACAPPAPAATAAAPPSAAGAAATPLATPRSAAVAAAAAPSPAPPARPPVQVKMATQRLATDAPIFLARERGYFAEQGLDVELEDITTGQGAIPPLAAGQLDVGVGAVSSGLFNAIARGIDIKLVATKGAIGPDVQSGFVGPMALVLSADLAASGQVQDYADLRGRTLALGERGAAMEVMLDRALQPSGLTTNDLDFRLMPYPDMVLALANRAIDGAMEIEPFVSQGRARGALVPWRSAPEMYPGQQAAMVAYGPTMLRHGLEAGQRLMVAYTRGLRDYHEAFGPKRRDRDAVVAVLVDNTPLKDPALYEQMAFSYLSPDCFLNVDAMHADLEWYHARGYVPTKPDLAQLVDTRYCDYAIQQLGRYQP